MSTFQDLLNNIQNADEHKAARIAAYKSIEEQTKRPLILYAANTRKGGFNIPNSIDDSDITGFSDLIENIKSKEIDVILHSPGGTAEATERIVNLLRENFNSIRFLIPNAAYSAATMLALCGDEILMDERSTLGPIDPQIIITTRQGIIAVPTQDILDGFNKILDQIKRDPDSIGVYLPMLEKYDLHTFQMCENAKLLALTLARDWLEKYMLKDSEKSIEQATFIAGELMDHSKLLSHGRMIGIKKCQELGLKVKDLRKEPVPRNELWKVYCLIEILFDRTTMVKLFENSQGIGWARHYSEQVIQVPLKFPPQSPPQQNQPTA